MHSLKGVMGDAKESLMMDWNIAMVLSLDLYDNTVARRLSFGNSG